MPRLSAQKKEKVQEQILFHMYNVFPKQIFISDIAKEIARDEEFVKILMQDLEKKNLIVKIDKNPAGITYLKRSRWRLSNEIQEIYRKQSELSKNSSVFSGNFINAEENSENSQ